MTHPAQTPQNWKDAVATILHPRVVTMLFFGFSAGMPILLIFSSLSLWLREAGVERSAVTFFSWAALGYSFKFIWAPLIDTLPVPVLTRKLGRRRAWILVSQFFVILAILWMALTNPAGGAFPLTFMALAAVMLGFSSATQDIVIDAYRIESAGTELQAMMSSAYIAGYRIAMIVAGAGALFLASYFGSSKGHYDYAAWRSAYALMAMCMLIGVATTLIIDEPEKNKQSRRLYSPIDYLGVVLVFLAGACGFVFAFFLTAGVGASLKAGLTALVANPYLAGATVEAVRLFVGLGSAVFVARLVMVTRLINTTMVTQTYIAPVLDFFQRYGKHTALILLMLVGLYRISDIVLGVISNVFYQDIGFSKPEIASIIKTFGLVMTIAGGFLGGILSTRYGVIKILFLGGLLSALTNLLFMVLAGLGHHVPMLYVVISADNLSAGLASAAFVAFLSSLTSIEFTAVQYAVFSSLMTLIPKVFGGYSGTIVDAIGYPMFFLLTTLIGIPVLFIIWLSDRFMDPDQKAGSGPAL